MRKRIRIGELVVGAGLITEEQLSAALQEHKRHGIKLGQYLIKSGLCKETEIVELISRQMRIPRYTPGTFPVDMAMAEVLSAEHARQYNLAPLARDGRVLAVAMPDPMDIDSLDAVEFATDCEVEPVVCTEAELNQLYGTLYGVYSDLDNVLTSIEDVSISAEECESEASGPYCSLEVQVDEAAGAEEAPVIRLVNSILAQAVSAGASDAHISPEQGRVSVRFRVDGKLTEVPAPPKRLFLPLVSRIKLLSGMDIAVSRVPQDGRFTVSMQKREINVRASCLPTIYGENVVLRLLDVSSGGLSLEQLGLDDSELKRLRDSALKPHGMIMATGPTGSGKSTSLYAVLKEIAKPDINVITLEDPVEYRMAGIRQVQLNRKAGMSFANGLKSILRQDPDVVMVGEIRDSETAQIAVQAALTGHRVLSTVHTNDAAGAITRLLDMGIEPFLVSSVLLASMAQRLLRRICPVCAEDIEPDPLALQQFGIEPQPCDTFRRGAGCVQCMHTGYRGRTGIYEILSIDETIQQLIVSKASAGEIAQAAKKAGKLRTLREAAAQKVRTGVTTLEEAASAVLV